MTVIPNFYMDTMISSQIAADKHREAQSSLQAMQLQNAVLAKQLSHFDEMQQLAVQKQQSDINQNDSVTALNQHSLVLSKALDESKMRYEAALAAKTEGEVGQNASESQSKLQTEELARQTHLMTAATQLASPLGSPLDDVAKTWAFVNGMGVSEKEKGKAFAMMLPQVQSESAQLKQKLDMTKQEQDALIQDHMTKALEQKAIAVHQLSAAGFGDTAAGQGALRGFIQPLFPGVDLGTGPLVGVRPRTGSLTPDQQVDVAAKKSKLVGLQTEFQKTQDEYKNIEGSDEGWYRDKKGNKVDRSVTKPNGSFTTYTMRNKDRRRELESKMNDLQSQINSLNPDAALKSAVAGAVAPASQPAQATPSQADLEFTAKKYGITVEEVKKRLGIK